MDDRSASCQRAVFPDHTVFAKRLSLQRAVFSPPIVLLLIELTPTATLSHQEIFSKRARDPIARLLHQVLFVYSADNQMATFH